MCIGDAAVRSDPQEIQRKQHSLHPSVLGFAGRIVVEHSGVVGNTDSASQSSISGFRCVCKLDVESVVGYQHRRLCRFIIGGNLMIDMKIHRGGGNRKAERVTGRIILIVPTVAGQCDDAQVLIT